MQYSKDTTEESNVQTNDVRDLVNEALEALPKPYSENVIDDVFFAIQSNPRWLPEYEGLCLKHSKSTTNSLGAYWIGRALGKKGHKQVPNKKSSLIGSYSVLDTDALPPKTKPKEPAARELMSEYFYANQNKLPATEVMKQYRDAIVGLIMDGQSPEEAFAIVLRTDA